ncbi:hypothetical protein CHR37_06465 [Bacillus velezensis]|nr:hypothetical protein CHR37_06465 [Bacillus velezensis]
MVRRMNEKSNVLNGSRFASDYKYLNKDRKQHTGWGYIGILFFLHSKNLPHYWKKFSAARATSNLTRVSLETLMVISIPFTL